MPADLVEDGLLLELEQLVDLAMREERQEVVEVRPLEEVGGDSPEVVSTCSGGISANVRFNSTCRLSSFLTIPGDGCITVIGPGPRATSIGAAAERRSGRKRMGAG